MSLTLFPAPLTTRRHAEILLVRARAAGHLLLPNHAVRSRGYDLIRPEGISLPFTGPTGASVWLEDQLTELLEMVYTCLVSGWWDVCLGLAEGLWPALRLHQRFDVALMIYGRGLDAAEQCHDQAAMARMRTCTGLVLLGHGQHVQALHQFQHAERLCEQSSDSAGAARSLHHQALARCGLGEPVIAAELFEEAVIACGQTKDVYTCALARHGLAELALCDHAVDQARAYLDTARAQLRQTPGAKLDLARTEITQGRLDLTLGAFDQADETLLRAQQRLEQLSDPYGIGLAYLARAEWHARQCDLQGAQLWDRIARNHFAALSAPVPQRRTFTT